MKLVLVCLFAFVLCTVHGQNDSTTANVDSTTELATQANEDHTHATDGATQAHEDHTHATDGATQAHEDHTHANDGVTHANDGVTGGSSDATTDSNSVITCYSCGNYSNNMMSECKSTDNTTFCPEKECWIYLNEKDGKYARGCKSTDNKAKDFKCDDYTTETCTTVDSASLCAKCCESKECNNGELAGKKSSASTSFSGLFLAVAAATVVVSLTK